MRHDTLLSPSRSHSERSGSRAISVTLLVTLNVILLLLCLVLYRTVRIERDTVLRSEADRLAGARLSAADSAVRAEKALEALGDSDTVSDRIGACADYVIALHRLEENAVILPDISVRELCHYAENGEEFVLSLAADPSAFLSDADRETLLWLYGYTARLAAYFTQRETEEEKTDWKNFFDGYSYPGYETLLFPVAEEEPKTDKTIYLYEKENDLRDLSRVVLGRNVQTEQSITNNGISCMRFECENAFCDLSRIGGKLIRLAIAHRPGEPKLSEREAMETANSFANRRGCGGDIIAHDTSRGFLTATLLPDRADEPGQTITVTVGLDTGRVYGFCAESYYAARPAMLLTDGEGENISAL